MFNCNYLRKLIIYKYLYCVNIQILCKLQGFEVLIRELQQICIWNAYLSKEVLLCSFPGI